MTSELSDPAALARSAERLRADVEALPAPRNRLHSPGAMARAEEWILEGFAEAGWRAERRPFSLRAALGLVDYDQEGVPAGTQLKLYRGLEGANLLAVKPGLASTDALLVGAHFDTIRDSPGADDNTASVAALVELARSLAPFGFRDTLVLAAFDMEEIGFLGSQALLDGWAEPWRLRGAVVYETMAYTDLTPGSQSLPPGLGWLYPRQVRALERRGLKGDWSLVLHRRASASLARAFARGLTRAAGPEVPVLIRDRAEIPVLGPLLLRLAPALGAFARSDHLSFWEAGIPALMVSDTAELRNPHYHQPSDTPETLDYLRLAQIVAATALALAETAGLEGAAAGAP